MPSPHQLTEHFFRHQYGKLVAVLVRYFGLKEVEIAEDIAQDTLLEAMEKWSMGNIPANPGGWLMDVAKKKTINFLKRNQHYQQKVLPKLSLSSGNPGLEEMAENEADSTLRMLFACCHPDLPYAAQIALALKTLCGLSVPEIAHALLTTEANINKRLYRAKQKFREGKIAFVVPEAEVFPDRLSNVCSCLYLLFNEGYYSAHPEKSIRMDLCYEAIRLQKQLVEHVPDDAQATALLALMLFHVARFESRMDDAGSLRLLAEQDRTHWDKQLIAEGITWLTHSIQQGGPNPYQLQAGIAAEHCVAASFAETNWQRIYDQYSLLEQLAPQIGIQLNKAIARYYLGERSQALSDLDELGKEGRVIQNPHYHIARGVFCLEMGEGKEAKKAFLLAKKAGASKAEIALMHRRLQ